MKKIILFYIFSFTALIAHAENNSADTEPYNSGGKLFSQFKNSFDPEKEWQFLNVPVDYSHPEKGLTQISFALSKNFSLDKKTLLHFNGGPGDTSVFTSFSALKDINIIYFNQRGVAYSRPETKSLFYSQDYYSSENTARDALEIIKHIGINSVTVYGISYGTVPATIFASLFPQYTRNVILEGVVFEGKPEMWASQYRINLIQRFFKSLDKNMQENILTYSRRSEVFAGWFSQLCIGHMYSSHFEKYVKSDLEYIFKRNSEYSSADQDKIIIHKLLQYGELNAGDEVDSITFASNMYNFITCKELNISHNSSSIYSVFNSQGQLVPYIKKQTDVNTCQKLNITKYSTYSAANYPVNVPVYYFQGTSDGATPADMAIKHFKNVAMGKTELILAKGSGHTVIYNYLVKILKPTDPSAMSEYEKDLKIQEKAVKIFTAAVNNEKFDLSEINSTINDPDSSWVETFKDDLGLPSHF